MWKGRIMSVSARVERVHRSIYMLPRAWSVKRPIELGSQEADLYRQDVLHRDAASRLFEILAVTE